MAATKIEIKPIIQQATKTMEAAAKMNHGMLTFSERAALTDDKGLLLAANYKGKDSQLLLYKAFTMMTLQIQYLMTKIQVDTAETNEASPATASASSSDAPFKERSINALTLLTLLGLEAISFSTFAFIETISTPSLFAAIPIIVITHETRELASKSVGEKASPFP